MKNQSLIQDYCIRSKHRIEAVELLLKRQSYADVVREAQEVVELLLKALLRYCHVEVPRIHDVSNVLEAHQDKCPESIVEHIPVMCKISRQMRRDRELAFYGTEDLTPSEFYQQEDAETALKNAKFIFDQLEPILSSSDR
jgi:HEPN domain-containing protein